jgi:ribonuclease E
MRLRDLGGLIVIDFIDMEESRNRRDVENRLRDALRQDRARVQFGTISKFGLMEMSRQRLRPALSEGASIPCPRCGGSGHIRDTESSALQILRIIQEESLKDNTASVLCQVPVDVASFLLNEKRTEIAKIELKQRINVLMVPNKTLETPNYKLERLKHDDPRLDNIEASYKMADEVEDPTSVTRRSQEPTNKQTPIIKGVLPDAPAPAAVPKPEAVKPAAAAAQPGPVQAPAAVAAPVEKGFFAWLKSLFMPEAAPAAKPAPEASKDDKRDGRGPREGARRGEPRGEGREDGRGNRGGRNEARGETRGGRGGRGGRADRPAPGQRERFDAEGKPMPADVDMAAPQAAVVGSGQEAPKSETRSDRPARNGERGERGNRGERGERGRGERTTEGGERPAPADRGAPRAEGRGERRPDRNRRPEENGRHDVANEEQISPQGELAAPVNVNEPAPALG